MATDVLTGPTIMGTATRIKVYKNFIDGEWVEASTGQTFKNRNPADTRDVIGIFQRSGKADVDAAIGAAKKAFAKWRLIPAPRLCAVMTAGTGRYLAATGIFMPFPVGSSSWLAVTLTM